MTFFNDLGSINETCARRWTTQAIECYRLPRCSFCTLSEHLKKDCKMKICIIELTKKHGAPKINGRKMVLE